MSYAVDSMVVLRCTQRLLERLKQANDLPPVESTTRLGDWYGNILRIGHRQLLLFISERSRLPVIIPAREARQLPAVFPEAVCQMLAIVGVPPGDIAAERSRMREMAFGRTRNRSVLGTMNDYGSCLQPMLHWSGQELFERNAVPANEQSALRLEGLRKGA